MVLKCPLLSERERSEGARLVEWFGWQAAADFGDWLSEYDLLRRGCGLSVLPGMACVRTAGQDARDYLHRRLTATISRLSPGEGTRAALLTGEGRMLADCLVLCTGATEFLLVAPPACAATLASHVERYVIREDCTVENQSDHLAVLSLDGPAASDCLTGLKLETVGRHAFLRENPSVLVVRTDSLGVQGYHMIVPTAEASAVWENLRSRVGGLCGLTARETVRVESGIPLYGRDMDETTIPLEAGLEAIIDFNKGCFPGQEIVARMRNLGHPAKVMVGLRFDGENLPAPTTSVTDGATIVGRVTSSVWSPALGAPLALATVKWAYREAGTTLQANGRQATVWSLPVTPRR